MLDKLSLGSVSERILGDLLRNYLFPSERLLIVSQKAWIKYKYNEINLTFGMNIDLLRDNKYVHVNYPPLTYVWLKNFEIYHRFIFVLTFFSALFIPKKGMTFSSN